MILQRENVQRISDDKLEIEELKSQGYVEILTEEKEEPRPEDPDLDSLSYSELKKLAKAKGITGASSLKKAELLEVLRG